MRFSGTRTKRRGIVAALGGLALIGAVGSADAALIELTDRESTARNQGFAAAGSSTTGFDVSDTETALTGVRTFNSSEDRPVSGARNGSARTEGALNVFEAIVLENDRDLTVAVTRAASAEVSIQGVGTQTATSMQTQTFRLDFRLTGEARPFTLTGGFAPGVASGTASVSFGIVGETPIFELTGSDPAIDVEGVIDPLTDPGAVYRFEVLLSDSLSSLAGPRSSISSYDLTLAIIPEPAGLGLAALAFVLVARRRAQHNA